MKPIIYSGVCMCGHSWEEHHLGMVMRPEIAAVIGPYVPGACLKYGSNEDEGLDEHGELHCAGYVDKDEPDEAKRNHWRGTHR